jgi:phosphoribosylglycinamide formyltransferase 1
VLIVKNGIKLITSIGYLMSPRIAVLASGEGTTLQCIMETFNVVLVISNKRYSGALRRARQFDVPGIVVGETAQPDMDMLATLESSGADLVVLTGYMQKVGKLTLKAYQGRIINTHTRPCCPSMVVRACMADGFIRPCWIAATQKRA